VLEAMQVDPLLARCAVRISLGYSNTLTQVEEFLKTTREIVASLRSISSLSF
jgi:cysteine desulfurase